MTHATTNHVIKRVSPLKRTVKPFELPRHPSYIVHDDATGDCYDLLEREDMGRRYVDRDPRQTWVANIAKVEWMVNGVRGRRITSGSMLQSRDLAVEAYVRMCHVFEEVEVVAGVTITPTYSLDKDARCYVLGTLISMFGSETVPVKDFVINRDCITVTAETFVIIFPVAFTEAEWRELEQFRSVTEAMDPIGSGSDAP